MTLLFLQIDFEALDTRDAADLSLDCGPAMGALNSGDLVCDRLRHARQHGWDSPGHYTP